MIRLSQEDTAGVLDAYGARFPVLLATELTRAGYVLVAAGGEALEMATERGDLASLPPAAPEQAQRIEAWCDPARSS